MTPDEFTNQELMLTVGDGHELYVQDWGNPQAKTPILFLHGGPGGGCSDSHKGYFDPAKHRVIFHDQRGSGKSTPYGSLEHNTTDNLVADVDKILDHFKLNRVILCGRSWGSSLSLVYSVHAPEKVEAVVVGGVFLADNTLVKQTFDNFDTTALFFPDRSAGIGSSKKYDELWKAASANNGEMSKRAAYKLAHFTAHRLDDRFMPINYALFNPAPLIMEARYQANNWYLPAGYILKNAAKITSPVWIVQGRYDLVCVPKHAYELHQKLPDSHLTWTQAGHSGNDRENWLATKTILSQLVS
jgi:proline iminopeptidase